MKHAGIFSIRRPEMVAYSKIIFSASIRFHCLLTAYCASCPVVLCLLPSHDQGVVLRSSLPNLTLPFTLHCSPTLSPLIFDSLGPLCLLQHSIFLFLSLSHSHPFALHSHLSIHTSPLNHSRLYATPPKYTPLRIITHSLRSIHAFSSLLQPHNTPCQSTWKAGRNE